MALIKGSSSSPIPKQVLKPSIAKKTDSPPKVQVVALKFTKSHRAQTFIQGMKNIIHCMSTDSQKLDKLTYKEKDDAWFGLVKSNFNDMELKVFKMQMKEFMPIMFGVKEPEIRLSSDADYLIMSAGSPVALTFTTSGVSTVGMNFTKLNQSAIWATLFDEFQLMGNFEIRYIPLNVLNASAGTRFYNMPTLVGIIDYNDGAALGNLNAALAYDTHKIFYAFPIVAKATYDMVEWRGDVQGAPVDVWTPTASNVTAAYLKVIAAATIDTLSSTTQAGLVLYSLKLRFRQLN